ncbi:MAG: hypothetical protein ACKV2T_43235 [Kofleriaceae bacterium]
MITGARFVVGIALLAAACGNKIERSERVENVAEQCINRELVPLLGQLEAAVPLLEAQKGWRQVDMGGEQRALREKVVLARSYLVGLLIGARKLAHAPACKASLDSLVAIATELANQADTIEENYEGGTGFVTEAIGEMNATLRRYAEWKAAFIATTYIAQEPLSSPATLPPIRRTQNRCGGSCLYTATSSSLRLNGSSAGVIDDGTVIDQLAPSPTSIVYGGGSMP